MKNRIIALIGSFFVFAAGLLRIFNESLSSTPLFVAYVFIITGFIGIVANGLKLKESKNN
ncbi:hypothetical protein [Bacillus sp. FJAT-29814]|uniref:hypothetical protein n=1 Tax=Bacillus sp. FJAT-29814 TaxID=1729688 RepID=UPI0009EB6528|nr:hypothetical protein [Bacillus sp. FJAT-29814]